MITPKKKEKYGSTRIFLGGGVEAKVKNHCPTPGVNILGQNAVLTKYMSVCTHSLKINEYFFCV